MTLINDFTHYLPARIIKKIAKSLLEQEAWNGLCDDQKKMLAACEKTYKSLRGKSLRETIKVSCPA